MHRWLIVGGVMLLTGLGCGSPQEPMPIHIGHVANLDGGNEAPGPQAVFGIRLALEEVNQDKKEMPLEVTHTNTRGNLDAYGAEAMRLLTVNQVSALLGGNTPGQVLALDRAKPVSTENYSAARPILAFDGFHNASYSDYVYLLGLTPAQQGEALGRFAAEELKATSLTLLVDTRSDAFRQCADAAVRGFREAQAKLKKNDATTPLRLTFGDNPKLAELLPRIKADKGGALLVAGEPGDFRHVQEEIATPGLTLLFGGNDGHLTADDVLPGNNIYTASAFAADADNKSVEVFVKSFREAFKVEPTVHAALAYDAIKILAPALRKKPTWEAFRKDLEPGKQFDGVVGRLSFTADQQVERPVYILKSQEQSWRLQQTYALPSEKQDSNPTKKK